VNLADANTLISSGMAFLPEKMDTLRARALLLAIGLQESEFRHRIQITGPARGFWQFEQSGTVGVMTHPATKDMAVDTCKRLECPTHPPLVHQALQYADTLAVVFARLNLWWLPQPLPGPDDQDEAWRQYLAAWRPGRPRPEKWQVNFTRAWDYVQ
jgi:hypothetical protein